MIDLGEKASLQNYWKTDKEKKLKILGKYKFKNETTDEEEIFRFIFNDE